MPVLAAVVAPSAHPAHRRQRKNKLVGGAGRLAETMKPRSTPSAKYHEGARAGLELVALA
jgi:hypothetical protein